MQEVMGEDAHAKYAEIKLTQAERCPKALGTLIKASQMSVRRSTWHPVSGHDANTTAHLAKNLAGVRYRLPYHSMILRDGQPVRVDYGEVDH